VTSTHLADLEQQAANPAGTDGMLQTVDVGAFTCETGGHLPQLTMAYETWGTLNDGASNAVLVHHALTGSSHVARGHSGEDGWWDALVGPGKTIDTDHYFVVATNMLGGCYGTTGPGSLDPEGVPWGSRFPFVTIRDSVRAEALLADRLGIARWHAVVGGSMGGARALEWALIHPGRVAHCAVVACGAASTAEQIAFAQAQVEAVRLDPHFAGGDYYGGPVPARGLGLARRIAHTTYRSEPELEFRFGRMPQGTETPFGSPVPAGRGRYQVESYLDHQAAKLAERFDANSYVVLTEALMSHDVTRDRGPLADVLRNASAEFLVAAVDSDRLYLPEQSSILAQALPGEVEVHTIRAPTGHDAFLTDIHQLDSAFRERFFPLSGRSPQVGDAR
jgi:homoserine O-acetyltransferase